MAKADDLIERLRLTKLAKQQTRSLSRGQKQKLSLSRALVHDPTVLLLDEPASGLDPSARVELRQLVRQLAADGRTVLVSSHVLAELDEMADRAVYLSDGATASAERLERARTSRREWRIRTLDRGTPGGQAAVDALRAVGIADADLRADGRDLLVPFAGDEAAAEALGTLVRAGVGITAFAPAVGELEHTFLDLDRERGA